MYILNSDIDKYTDLSEVTKLSSMEDIATLVNTYERVISDIDRSRVSRVLQDGEGFYYFVLDGGSTFELYDFIEKSNIFNIQVNCINAKLVFPESLSRGVNVLEKDDSFDSTSYLDEDDAPTGYLEDSIEEELNLFLVRVSDDSKSSISKEGLIVGRQSNKVDVVVKGNTNVGRVHCKFYFENGSLKVRDLESLNGTFVNNKRVKPNDDCTVSVGDTILLADEKFIITS